jgi:calpain-15
MKEGDSYFVAAITALAQNEGFVQDLFDDQFHISITGAYKLKVSINGRPTEFIIDDHLPVFTSNHLRAVFCQIEPGMAWLPLLEKAYAKINGSYEKITWGFAHEVL